jgi:monothiol glutaredoxin
MSQPNIVAYLKPSCGWSNGVRAILAKYRLSYEDKDIINFIENREEMIRKSGQDYSPCVEVDGQMLPNISGEELEAWMVEQKLIEKSDAPVNVPINQPCAHEMASPTSVKVHF